MSQVEQWFLSYRFQNRCIWKNYFQNHGPDQKVLEVLPPKSEVRPNKVLGAQKKFLGPLKTQKIDFLKKGPSYNLSET